MFTFDPGFTSTASCESKITFIDGDEGILLHRGFPIDQLATDSNYLEVCYILLNGEKPTQEQYDEFKTTVTRHTMIHEQITRLFHAFRRDSHPMAVMCGITGALAAFYHDSLDVNNPRHREIAAFRLLSKMPTMAAMCYKYSIGQPFVYPRNDLSYAGNFLNMMFSTPCEPYEVNPILERAMDRILILHADHEQNASTSTVRTAGSSGANPFACIAAGIASLWGPAHGGANEGWKKSPQNHILLFVVENFFFRLVALKSPPLTPIRWVKMSCAGSGYGAGKHRAERPVLYREKLYPERRFLLWYHPESDGYSVFYVHRDLRYGTYGWLDRPLERNAQ